MADTSSSDGSGRSRRRAWPWALRLLLLAAVVAVLLYFGLTSGAFLKSVVLPRVGAALQARVTASTVALSPFSQIELRNLKIETAGPQPLVEVERVLVRYRLWSLVRGNLVFPEIVLESPRVALVQQPDGKWNWDPLVQRESPPASPSRAAVPTVKLGRLTLSKGEVRFSQSGGGGVSRSGEITGIEVELEGVGNLESGKARLAAALALAVNPVAGSTNGVGRLQTRLGGTAEFKLMKDLRPESLKSDVRLDVAQATGAFRELAGLAGVLACDVAPTQIRELTLRFERGESKLGTIRLRGPYDLARSEARFGLDVAGIDRNALNLIGAPFGLDFGETVITGSGSIDIAPGGDSFTTAGRGSVSKLSVRKGAQTSPTVDLTLDFQVTVNPTEESATVNRLLLEGKQAGRSLLKADLGKKTLYLSWGRQPQGISESVLTMEVNDLRLEDWGLLLGTNAPSGTVTMTNKITSQLDGRKLTADTRLEGKELSWRVGGYRLDRGALSVAGSLNLNDYRSIILDRCSVRLEENGAALLVGNGSASYDLDAQDFTVQATADSDLPTLLRQLPVASLSATSGKVHLDALASQGKGQNRAELTLTLSGFTGAYADYRFQNYEVRLGLDGEQSAKTLNLRRLQVGSRQRSGDFGAIDVSGSYDRILGKGEFVLNLDRISEGGLEPFIDPVLLPRKLRSVLIGGSGKLRYDEADGGAVGLLCDLRVDNLRLQDPSGMLPDAPFNIQLGAEGTYRTNHVEVTRLSLALPSTPRTTENQLTGTGRMTLVPTNAMTGQLSLRSEILDLSGVLDAFVTNQAKAVTATGTAPSAAPDEQEPGPFNLPIRQLTADLHIGHVYMKDMVVSNWTAAAKLSQNLLTIDPVSLTLNGAPVSGSGRVDLGKPGFVYDVALQAQQVPLDPVVTSFAPDRRGQLTGELGAKVQISGAGITGPNLQRSLSGQFEGGSTNLNLALGNVRSSLLKSVINTVMGIPELVRNPGNALGNLLGQLTGGNRVAGSSSAWVDEFAKSPIRVITARGKAGGGKVELAEARIESPAFLSLAQGTITLAPVLTNSALQIPLQISLRRAFAEQAGLVPAGTPTNATYAKLPDFVTVQGTLGEPKAKVNAVALTALAAKAGAGLVGGTGNASLDKAAGVLGAVGNLLGGGGARTNVAATNAPAGQTNPPAASGNPLLDLFKRK